MPAGTTGTIACSESDQQSGYDQGGRIGINLNEGKWGYPLIHQGRNDQAREKGNTPADVAGSIETFLRLEASG